MDAKLQNHVPTYVKRPLNQHRVNAVEEYAGNSVLDVGCGNGAYVFEFNDRLHIRGTDSNYFESWSKNRDLFSVSDAHELKYEDDSFDTVVSFETLEHLSNPEKALTEMHRVCRDNVIITVPNCHLTKGMESSRLIFYHWIDHTHLNFWNSETLTSLMENSGFKIQNVTLINRLSLGHLFSEALCVPKPLQMVTSKALSFCLRKKYFMTILVVASKLK